MLYLQGMNNERVILFNKKLVLFLLYVYKSLSISDLAKSTNLSISAVSRLVGDLEKDNLVHIISTEKPTRGKSAGLVSIKDNGINILCLEIRNDKIYSMLCSSTSEIISDIKEKEINLESKDELIKNVEDVVKSYLNTKKDTKLNVALAIHGQVDYTTGTSLVMPQAAWHDSIDFKFILESKYNVNVLADNDCAMRALAVKWYLLSQKCKQQDICTINLDYGIGSSFLINNDVYRGSIFGSGQIGHTIVDPTGKQCSCGRFGCLETIASKKAIVNAVNFIYQTQKRKFLSFDEIVALYKEDDEIVVPIVNHAAICIGITIYNFLNAVNVNRIYLFGCICDFGDKFLKTIESQITKSPFDKEDQINEKATMITYSTLPYKEQLRGISYLFIEKFLEDFYKII